MNEMRKKMNKTHNTNRLMNNRIQSYTSINHQKGVVLLWAVVFLMVITIVGLSAIRMSGIDTQISGNSVTSMLAFQGAESALGRTAPDKDTLYNIDQASLTANLDIGYDVVAADFFPPEPVSGGGQIISSARVQAEDKEIICPATTVATSSGIKCNVFRVDAKSVLQGTGAKANHTVGLAIYAP